MLIPPKEQERKIYHPIVADWLMSQGYVYIAHEPCYERQRPDFVASKALDDDYLIIECKLAVGPKPASYEAVAAQLFRYEELVVSHNPARGHQLILIADYIADEAKEYLESNGIIVIGLKCPYE